MDLHRLEVFCKLVDTGSFSKTARELDLTQPTVSGHIKTLEQTVGLQLFDRHKRQVRPTSAALVLYEYAKRMLDIRKEAGYALERFRGRISGRLTLGGSTIPGTYILPPAIGRFHRIYEETYLVLTLGDTAAITESVAKGDIEMGVVGAESENENLEFEPLIEDEMVLAVPARPTWKGWKEPSRALSPARLRSIPFILREQGSGTRKVMLKALAERDVKLEDLNVAAEMGSTESVRQAVKAGLGATILSRVAVAEDVEAGRVDVYNVQGLDLTRRFFLVTDRRRTRSPVCGAFIEFLRAECKAGGRPGKQT
jgi:DNA-binding transcriptional LysR family regulator